MQVIFESFWFGRWELSLFFEEWRNDLAGTQIASMSAVKLRYTGYSYE
jgi:hypothetical protein